jgi:hypothetical protein
LIFKGFFVSAAIAMNESINANDFGFGMFATIISVRMNCMLLFNVAYSSAARFFIASNGFISTL